MQRLPWTILIAIALMTAGCGGSKLAEKADRPPTPIQVQTSDLKVTLAGILGVDDEGTLVKDEGWREYVLEVENLSFEDLTVKNVKLLNPTGRYIDSASAYDQIIVPPNTTLEVAGDVAKTAAGFAAGQIIPYGGFLVSMLSSATSTATSGTKGNAQRTFVVRVLKGVELAPGGKVAGSAFLPDIPDAKELVIDYLRGSENGRVEIALPHAQMQASGSEPRESQRAAAAAAPQPNEQASAATPQGSQQTSAPALKSPPQASLPAPQTAPEHPAPENSPPTTSQ
jgi:hypothetical protein